MLEYENELHKKNIYLIAGIDEVGRGPLYGPVVAACVVMKPNFFLEEINDSKKLSEKKREILYEIIKNKSVSYSINFASVEEIEELKRERDGWKSSTCSYMNKDSILSMDCQIVQEALWELEKEIEFGSKSEDLFFDLKEKFEKLNNHRIGVF